MSRIVKVVEQLNWWVVGVGVVFMMGIVAIVDANVITRFVGYPILGTIDIVNLAAAVAASCCFALTQIKKRHIIADFLVTRFSERTRAILDGCTLLLGFIIVAVITVASAVYTKEMFLAGEYTHVLEITIAPFRVVFTVGFALFGVTLLLDVIASFRRGAGRSAK